MSTVLIPSAGTGSRLHGETSKFNKALVSVGDRPAITYVIDHFTKDDKIVICTGYAADTLKQVINAIYPDWNIQFVDVDKYEGEGSGPGYSIICAREVIGNDPFFFMCNDTIINDDLKAIEEFGKKRKSSIIIANKEEDFCAQYRHILSGNPTCYIEEKSDKGGHAYIGAAYVNDAAKFFEAYDKDSESFIKIGEVAGLNNLGKKIVHYTESWEDTGNEGDLQATRTSHPSRFNVLEKSDERIYVYGNKVIKLHNDPEFIVNRVARHKTMTLALSQVDSFCMPKLLSFSENTYVYEYVEGEIMSNVKDASVFEKMMQFFQFQHRLKRLSAGFEMMSPETKRLTRKDFDAFYVAKTKKRYEKYLENTLNRGFIDRARKINGVICQPVKKMLSTFNWDRLYNTVSFTGEFTPRWHGDFHLENILWSEKEQKFYLLDWRQNFSTTASGLVAGDIYYDLAKLMHSFYIKDECIKNKEFYYADISEKQDTSDVVFDVHTTFFYQQFRETLENLIETQKYSKEAVMWLTAVLILNIAGCGHETKYSNLCFIMAQYLMNKYFTSF